MRGAHCVHAALAIVGGVGAGTCADDQTPDQCPWAGPGQGSITIQGGPVSLHGSSKCSSGAVFTAERTERFVQVCERGFDFTVSLEPDDSGSGSRTLVSGPLTTGSARINVTVLRDAAYALYASQQDPQGSLRITANFTMPGQAMAGSFDGVLLTRASCSSTGCDMFPQTLRASGTFSGQAR